MTDLPASDAAPRRYLVRTFGCQMNEHDSERISGLFDADGMEATTDLEEADVVVLNTCCIRENADNKLYGTLGHLKSVKDRKPGMEIVVAGCLAQKDKEGIQERAPYVDLVFGTHNVHRATELLHRSREEGPLTEILEATVADDHELFPSAMPARRDEGYTAWVTIQIGCDNSCAFCIVPAVRGEEISRPYDRLVDEVSGLASDGVTEVTLLGQNVNSYGRDLTLAARRAGDDVRVRPLFSELLRSVGAVDGIRRVRYTSPHPKDLRPETIAAMAETPEVCEHLHLPVQSGSDRVLAAMHRGYTAERYLEKLAAARAAIADLAVTTDLIVGFPGETDDDFEQTLALAAAAEYDSAYTFIYSPRPGTEAAEMVDQFVDPAVVAERFDRLKVVLERSALRKHEARIGRVEEVVVEGPSRKDPSVLTGRTRQNKLVHFASESPLRVGTYADVRITAAAPHFLRGDLIEVTAAARHRTRIPVAAG
ncbi:tRNA (N6-isopentenyl adenosine(37)-C2)-methylthiotransferase MiaB [Aquihabitans sp. McL0605]|uniref:tRNA (N6-isopentenyl adenosine(37)-C2)-methylthiotransferase MiaB n=1 Tax=Aquihabitans sp. McL0605 TaxID=3415671 RepID=UPI003CEBA47A